ncbi:DEAD/DEAH box helicase [Tepidamorphus sp. 3E244]|uniref:DEAD/DEAH box helicase n=1 Tax=Tepidamorphus sp. 3E244 TaxID=3385498 RepID=UPI0038FCF495
MSNFEMFGLAPTLKKAIDAAGFSEPTPIQQEAIPLAMQGRDVMGLAQTGTGKTLAFGLPLINSLLSQPSGKRPAKSVKALVLAPTRELANQIAESLWALAGKTGLRVSTVVGGQSIGRQINMLSKGTDILVATPGRLIDLMDRGSVDLGSVRYLVLDEADQMLDLGFIHALRKIAPKLGKPRQTMLFSATMPKQMEELSQAYLSDPQRVQVAPPGKAADKVTQSVHFIDRGDKPALLRDVLSNDLEALTLVFARTKHGAEKLMKKLVADGYNAASIHGNKSQGQRDRAIKAFREGKIKTLVATDVAARGIDIPGVAYVINYDLPEVPENYVHRIGRTARAGREGEAIAFCAPDEANLLRQIQKLMKIELPVASGTSPLPAAGEKPNRGSGAPRRRGPAANTNKPAEGHKSGKPGQSRRRRQSRNRNAA